MRDPEATGRSRGELTYLGLGANLGDRQAALQLAVEGLAALEGTSVLRLSPLYETEPLGPEQPWFLNAAVELRTELAPGDLLRCTRELEERTGRQRDVRWGPRELDIDLLLCGDRVIDTEVLRIPHPEMTRRSFVLRPLVDLAPNLRHPVTGLTLTEHFTALDAPTEVRPAASSLLVPDPGGVS